MPDLIRELIERLFPPIGGELRIGGVPVTRLAETHGTPLFVYDRGVLDRACAVLRATYPSEFALYYSVKANPTRAIVRHLLGRGFGLEIASGGEFHQALHAGCAPERILYAGPGKTEAELETVLSRGIGEVHIESLLEGQRVAAIGKRLGLRARVAIRINPGAEAQGGAMRMGGKSTPFGIDEEALEETLDRLSGHRELEIRGIHLFSGTQILDNQVLESQYRRGLEIGRRAAARLGHPLATLDFGGGLGIPYFPGDRAVDMGAWADRLRGLMAEVRGEAAFAACRFLVEPGRFLVGEAGVYLTRVTDVKTSRGKTYLVLDGGMNHHLAASGNLGQVIKRNFPVALVGRLDDAPTQTADLVGPLCTPLDVLARDVPVPAPRVGDLVGIFQSGAYARSASPLGFLSQLTPAEVMAGDGEVELARRRGTYEDLLADIC